jgi:PAS domain S-box-containing protein
MEPEGAPAAASLSRADFERIVESVPHIVWVSDAQGGALYVNRNGLEFTGRSTATDWTTLVHPDDVEATETAWSRAIATGSVFSFECRIRRHDGTYRWMESRANPTLEADGQVASWVGTWTDVDDRKGRAEDRRRYEAFRNAVLDNVAEGLYALDAHGRATYVNPAAAELLGYQAEELIGQDMHALVHHQRADGTPLRAEDCPLLKVRHTGRPVRMADETFTRRDGTLLPVTYSSAPLTLESDATGAVVVFRDATDDQSKQEAARRELEALAWIGRVREALDEDRLEMFSQPIMALGGGEDAEELLMRMRTRSGELVLPGCFIPTAERYGMITELDQWAMVQATELAATGRRIEVNVSAQSILTGKMLELIEHQLAVTGARPADLVVELTETALLSDLRSGEAFAHGLAELGCGLALDDFGTGYSSLKHLKRLPLTHLKIDIDFIIGLPSNAANQHLVQAIVDLARGFGIQTVAEGVEDAETLELVRAFGVDHAQGFHIGRPRSVRPARGR